MNTNNNKRKFPMRKNNNRKRYVNDFLIKNPEYHLEYNHLLKESKMWNSCGQYWMGQEMKRRSDCLLKGDLEGYKLQRHSHELFYPQIVNNLTPVHIQVSSRPVHIQRSNHTQRPSHLNIYR